MRAGKENNPLSDESSTPVSRAPDYNMALYAVFPAELHNTRGIAQIHFDYTKDCGYKYETGENRAQPPRRLGLHLKKGVVFDVQTELNCTRHRQ